MTLHVKNISKTYDKEHFVIDDISFTINANSIYCLLGRNGAGKSSLLNIIANLIKPTKGEILINDLTYATDGRQLTSRMGILSQFNQLIGELNARDFLTWIGLLYRMPEKQLADQIDNLLQFFFDDKENLQKPSKKYSSGMQKKLAICSAIINKPDILIMDEPFANLDPVACNKLCDFVKAYNTENRLILISSHDLLYVNRIATHIGILHSACLVFNDTLDHFKSDVKANIDQDLLKYLQVPAQDDNLINAII